MSSCSLKVREELLVSGYYALGVAVSRILTSCLRALILATSACDLGLLSQEKLNNV